MRLLGLLGFGLAALLPLPALAQACELHVWVVKNFHARGHFAKPSSDGVGIGITMYLKSYDEVQSLLGEQLSLPYQYETLRASGVGSIVMPGIPSVVEEKTTESRPFDIKKSPRIFASESACYGEFIVLGTLYEKTAVTSLLYTTLLFRRFEGNRLVQSVLKNYSSGVDSFPPKGAGELDAARDDVRHAFQHNLQKFLGVFGAAKH